MKTLFVVGVSFLAMNAASTAFAAAPAVSASSSSTIDQIGSGDTANVMQQNLGPNNNPPEGLLNSSTITQYGNDKDTVTQYANMGGSIPNPAPVDNNHSEITQNQAATGAANQNQATVIQEMANFGYNYSTITQSGSQNTVNIGQVEESTYGQASGNHIFRQDNSTVTQNGTGNTATVKQGDSDHMSNPNYALSSATNFSTINQNGDNNGATVTQTGQSTIYNHSDVEQTGSNGTVQVTQGGTSCCWSYQSTNDSNVYQYASNSTAIVSQTMNDNSSGTNVYTNYSQITQYAAGANDTATVTQNANLGNNTAYATQNGSGNIVHVTQH